jgi:hypothetical protein
MKPDTSWPQRRQRELAWMLYITEGYIANMQAALAINCVTFNEVDKKEAARIIQAANNSALRLRTHLSRIAITPQPNNKERKHADQSLLQPAADRADGQLLSFPFQAQAGR